VVTLLAYSGLRVSEALGLRWGNVRLLDGEFDVREQLQPGRGARATKTVTRLKSEAGYRTVPIFPAVELELTALLDARLQALRAEHGEDADTRTLDGELVFRRTGQPLNLRNVAQRGVEKAAAAGLGHVTPKLLRSSFCSLAARRGVDPGEAPQITGHSPAVWATHYVRSFGKEQRDEARARMLEHGFGAVPEPEAGAVASELDAGATT
jgi:integrase